MLKGDFIGVKGANTFELHKTIHVVNPIGAKMRVACLGLFFVKVNDKRVGKDYLVPGWTSYRNNLYISELDLSKYLVSGENEIVITVNEGWFKGPISWTMSRCNYGDTCAVCAEIYSDERIIITDKSWTATSSQIIKSGIYDGEIVDLTAKTMALDAVAVPFDKGALKQQICPFVQATEEIKPISVTEKDGKFVYDFGQNFAGIVELITPEAFDGTLTMRFAEILVNGEFYIDNLGTAKATDKFTCKGRNAFRPEFTYHGFRYMELSGTDKPITEVKGLVMHTPMSRTGYIQTSNARLNKLISNIVWGQRSNFVDIPSDCPQRSERLGWTGDINAFITSASYNYDIRTFIRKWLADVRVEQSEKGEIPFVIPNAVEGLFDMGSFHTSAMWSDVITDIPHAMYCMYGDENYYAENYEAMRRFVDCRIKRANGGLIKDGYEFGDWLSLDVEIIKSGSTGRTDIYFIANAFFVHSLDIVCEAALVLGFTADYLQYDIERKRVRREMQQEYFTKSGRFALDTITGQILALHFNIVPKAYRARLAADLNNNVKSYDYRVVTGFIGTPYLLFALSDNGYHETAGRVLLNNGYPGWLYEVDMGATTVWERWNTIMPDGMPNPDGMNSCNHYAYGSVIEFVYRRIAGIEPYKCGFKTFLFAPKPIKGIAEISAEYKTDYGIIKAGYRQANGKMTFFVNVPQNTTAKVTLPNGIKSIAKTDYEYTCEWANLNSPAYSDDCSTKSIFTNPKAIAAFDEAFVGVLHPKEREWLQNAQPPLAVLRTYLISKGRMNESEFDETVKKFNQLFMV